MLQYIASDIDGTLLPSGSQNMNPEIFELIRKLKEKGVHFIAASGRPYTNLYRLFEPVKDEISYVAENGSLTIHNNEIISTGSIDRELGIRIAEASRDFPGESHTLLAGKETSYSDSKDPEYYKFIRSILDYDIVAVNDFRDVKETFLKIAVYSPDKSEELTAYLRKKFESEIKVVTSGHCWTDFIAPDANKGSALKKMLDHLGLNPEKGIVFGDQYNDVEMLQLAGTSYAMANCAAGIEKYADHVTETVEEVLRTLV